MMKTPIYDSAVHKVPAIEEIREILRNRYLLIQLTRRDILARYKRSILGVAWTMLNPLGMMIILSIVFSQLFKTVHAYPAYLLCGLIAWNFFAQGTNAAMSGLVWGGSLIQRIYIPRSAFGISAIGTALINLMISVIPLLLVMLITKSPLTATILFLPIPIFFLACFTLGIGLILSTMAVYFPDVAEMYQIVLLAWFYFSPVIYPEEIIPAAYLPFYHLNPMYYLIRIFRLPIYDGRIPGWEEILPAALCGIGVLLFGWIFFTAKADEFAYRI
jgi:ABC-2 type transport system permease protein